MVFPYLISKFSPRSTRYFFTQYNDNTYRITRVRSCKESGWEEMKQTQDNFIIPQVESDESLRCSLSRTKRRIRELALSNDFEYFITVTVNSELADRYNLDICQDLLKKTIKAYKRKYNDLSYIFITEKHKDGAFHFHGLIKGLSSDDLYTNSNGYLSSHFFDKVGFNSFSKIRDYNKCCNYILKYITKDCVKNSNNQIYIRSRNLKEPLHYEIAPLPTDFEWKYSNDYVDIADFCNLEMTSQELLKKIFDEKIREI